MVTSKTCWGIVDKSSDYITSGPLLIFFGLVAQLVEQGTFNPEVESSILSEPIYSNRRKYILYNDKEVV